MKNDSGKTDNQRVDVNLGGELSASAREVNTRATADQQGKKLSADKVVGLEIRSDGSVTVESAHRIETDFSHQKTSKQNSEKTRSLRARVWLILAVVVSIAVVTFIVTTCQGTPQSNGSSDGRPVGATAANQASPATGEPKQPDHIEAPQPDPDEVPTPPQTFSISRTPERLSPFPLSATCAFESVAGEPVGQLFLTSDEGATQIHVAHDPTPATVVVKERTYHVRVTNIDYARETIAIIVSERLPH